MKLQTILNRAKQYSPDDTIVEKRETDRQSFIYRFPRESLKDLTIEGYANTMAKDSFIYWLEHKDILSGIGGGSAAKFGVYRAKSGDYCKGSGKSKVVLEGEALQKRFYEIKNIIIKTIELAEKDRIEKISELEHPFFNMVLLKIANIYVPEKFFNIYTPPLLIELGRELGVRDELLFPQYSIELNHEVKKQLEQYDVFKQWSTHHLTDFLWNLFAERDNKIDDEVNYYLVGHNYEGEYSVRNYCLENDCITIGFLREDLTPYFEDDIQKTIYEKEETSAGRKALKHFFSMEEGDYVGLKSSFTQKIDGETQSILRISALGKVKADAVDGYQFSKEYGHILPVEWYDQKTNEYVGHGGYRSTINRVKDKRAISFIFMDEENVSQSTPQPVIISNNHILYGPPGTGKTFHVVDRALEIIDPNMYQELEANGREALQQYYSQLVHTGTINSITFHQSYAYEDFIEGLKSDGEGNFVPADGLLKRIAIKAIYEGLEQKNTSGLSDEVRFEQLYEQLVTSGEKENVQFTSKTGGNLYIAYISTNRNLAITGQNAEKSSIVSKDRLLRVFKYIEKNEIDWENNTYFIYEAIGGCNTTRYWAVLNWILTTMKEEQTENSIEIEGDEKKKIVLKALEENKPFDFSNAKRYVLVIDELNRGNISKIFGELLTLLEDDKRLTMSNEMMVDLPYSKEKFSLPPNLFIIGTMNTADRSIAMLDTALRRRFDFEEMMPEPETLDAIGQEIEVDEMLNTINKRIEIMYDRDHMIGHAYFINAVSDEDVIAVMQSKVVPLLQEYFFDDWEKIGLVLGGIGTSINDSYIVYSEEPDVDHLFKQTPSIYVPTLYRVKKQLTIEELLAIYDEA